MTTETMRSIWRTFGQSCCVEMPDAPRGRRQRHPAAEKPHPGASTAAPLPAMARLYKRVWNKEGLPHILFWAVRVMGEMPGTGCEGMPHA